MTQTPYIFNQLVQWLPRDKFDRLVKQYKGNAYVKDFSCWKHLLVMIWAQLTSRRSLRDIETSLRAHSDKLYRMGMGRNISRNNIANANARRDVAIYHGLAQEMMRLAASAKIRDKHLGRIASEFSLNGFFAIDSSTVSLDLAGHPWCKPQKGGFGGVKLHTMYDIMREVPRMCLVTGREERDQTFMEDYPYEPGCFYVLDKAYVKTLGMAAIQKAKGFFVVRRKRNMVYSVVGGGTSTGGPVMADMTIRFTSRWASQGYPWNLRMVTFYVEDKNETMQFMTNNFDIPPTTVALLYKYRWQIELFFKWMKQHMRIVSFYGTSANAVMIQIYTAFITYCLLALVAGAIGYKGGLYDFSNLVSVSLTEKIGIKELVARFEKREMNNDGKDGTWPSLFD